MKLGSISVCLCLVMEPGEGPGPAAAGQEARRRAGLSQPRHERLAAAATHRLQNPEEL